MIISFSFVNIILKINSFCRHSNCIVPSVSGSIDVTVILNLLPLRIHSEEALRGFLFMQFLTLIAFVHIKNKLEKEHNVEEILLTLRNLKCKVYDKEIMVCEPNRQQKDIMEKLNILMPKKLGI